MKTLPLFVMLLILLVSCREDAGTTTVVEGTYTGQFMRLGLTERPSPSNVTLTLEGGKFTGYSDQARYPSICNGSYQINGGKIKFINECFWTADFDWSYILGGEYDITIRDRKIDLIQEINGESNFYQLELQR